MSGDPGTPKQQSMITNVDLDLTDPTPADLQAFVAEAPRLTTALVLGLLYLDGPRVVASALELESISGPVGASSVSDMAAIFVRAAEAGVLAKVPSNHGFGSVMAGAVVACRDRLLAQAA
jgi:hypothetical protein